MDPRNPSMPFRRARLGTKWELLISLVVFLRVAELVSAPVVDVIARVMKSERINIILPACRAVVSHIRPVKPIMVAPSGS